MMVDLSQYRAVDVRDADAFLTFLADPLAMMRAVRTNGAHDWDIWIAAGWLKVNGLTGAGDYHKIVLRPENNSGWHWSSRLPHTHRFLGDTWEDRHSVLTWQLAYAPWHMYWEIWREATARIAHARQFVAMIEGEPT